MAVTGAACSLNTGPLIPSADHCCTSESHVAPAMRVPLGFHRRSITSPSEGSVDKLLPSRSRMRTPAAWPLASPFAIRAPRDFVDVSAGVVVGSFGAAVGMPEPHRSVPTSGCQPLAVGTPCHRMNDSRMSAHDAVERRVGVHQIKLSVEATDRELASVRAPGRGNGSRIGNRSNWSGISIGVEEGNFPIAADCRQAESVARPCDCGNGGLNPAIAPSQSNRRR